MSSYAEQLKYRENGGEIVGGGFPLSNCIDREFGRLDEKSIKVQYGGSVGYARFEHLVIPVSVDSHNSTYYEPMVKNKITCREVINDDMFEELFNKVGVIKRTKVKTTHKSLPESNDKKTTRKKSK
jgi:hypothetical protein